MNRHRNLLVLRGSRAETRAEAERLVRDVADVDLLWVSDTDDREGAIRPNRVRRLLGRSYDAVVLDLHDVLDPDLLGQSHGFVWGGGALILRLPPPTQPPTGGQASLAVSPYQPADVGFRFHRHFERALDRATVAPATPVSDVSHDIQGTDEQARLAERLRAHLEGHDPGAVVVMADRGRGKSSAIGMALASLPGKRVAVTAGWPDSVAEVFRFALGDPAAPTDGPIRFVAPTRQLHTDATFDAIVVDEAAQIPVPVLQRIVERHPDVPLVFSTTTHGYEGTGRGFALRFVEWLAARDGLRWDAELHEPIRWGAEDPVERFVFDALLLDAEPAFADGTDVPDVGPGDVRHVALDRDRLVDDERLLAEFFGLLIHAHYRTTPGDLRRILDAPNLSPHALLADGHVVAATLVAEEGGLPEETVEAIYTGRTRVRGHALAETLVSHLGRRDAGQMTMIRSVRIATHPALRRRGLATRLIESIHELYDPDLFGTLFGATAGLLKFRRSVGYELVRVGASRGSRTGEPAAVMVRPVSERARGMMRRLRGELARDLPLQIELLEAGDELLLDERLREALFARLPEPRRRSEEELHEAVAVYAFGPRTYEAAATAVETFVRRHQGQLAELSASERTLIEGRALRRRSWTQLTDDAGLSSVRVTMRALRRAFRALVRLVEPSLEARWEG